MRVGVFDSGIGGLTVLKNLIDRYPNNEYIYFGDTKNMPYGSKSVNELKVIAKRDVEFLLMYNVDIIIIACGTISSNCLDYLKENYNIPIIDIISPTINYLNNSSFNNIGVIATEATINSHTFKNRLVGKNVYEISTPELVLMIEKNNLSNIDMVLSNYLDKYKDKFDVLVLGCTHYPLLTNYIRKIYDKEIINMGSLINIANNGVGSINVYFNYVNEILISNIYKILGNNINLYKVEY